MCGYRVRLLQYWLNLHASCCRYSVLCSFIHFLTPSQTLALLSLCAAVSFIPLLLSLFFISPSLTTAFLFILLLLPHPSCSFYLPSLSSTLQERLRRFQSTRRTLHVQRLEGIPLRSLSISLPVPSWSVCLPAVRITTSSITLAPAVVCSPVIRRCLICL